MMPANRMGAPERERPGPTRETGPLGKSAGTTHTDSANDTSAVDAARDDLRGYLDAVFGDMSGVAHIAIGSDPYLNDKGKYCFRKGGWTEHQFKWPDEADLVVREILRPSFARSWDPNTKVWRIDAGYVESLAASLREIGFIVTGLQSPRTAVRNTDNWATTLFRNVGAMRTEPVFRALSKILHPDMATGDTKLMQQLINARAEFRDGGR